MNTSSEGDAASPAGDAVSPAADLLASLNFGICDATQNIHDAWAIATLRLPHCIFL